MCEVHSKYNQNKKPQRGLLPFSIIEQVVTSALPYGLKEIIPSTMGEPLLYQEFERLIELVKNSSLKINLTTNGTFPVKGVEKWAKIILPVASDTKISMNGFTASTAERIMQGLSFEKQVSNLKKYIEVRDAVRKSGINCPTVTIQTTFMESNIGELPELLEMAIDLGVDRFKGHHVWITWPQIEIESLRDDPKSIMKWNQVVKRLHTIANNKRLPSGKKIELANIYPISVGGEGSTDYNAKMICPFLGKEAWISWDGRFDVCCAPDIKRRMLGEYGNVRDTDIMEIWQGEPYSQLVNKWGSYNVCRECNMKVLYGHC
jgi:MoaA/NifB/PqqE/SkfB family radical SAM enzyme